MLAVFVTAPAARGRAVTFVRTRVGAAALVAGFAVLVAAGALAANGGRLTLDDSGYREAFAAASLRMFQSSPLAGVGPGVWQVLRASYESAGQPDLYIPHAHSIYLQTLAEFGVVGVLAGLVVVGSLAALVFGAIRTGDETRRRVGLATLFAVVLLAGQQLVDMLMNVPALLLGMAIPLAWLDATAPGRARNQVPWDPSTGREFQARGLACYGTWLRLDNGFPPGPPVARMVLGKPLLQLPGGLDEYRSLYRRPVLAAQVVDILPQITFQDHF